MWKRRFPVSKLLEMRVKLEKICNIIMAAAILHNWTIGKIKEIPEERLTDEENDNELRNIKQFLISNHFARL